jgi:hypothetical protein
MILNGFKFDMTGSLERGIPVSYMPLQFFCLVQSKAWRKKYRNEVRMIFCSQPARAALSATRQKAIFAWKNLEYLRMDDDRTTVQLRE